MTPFNKWGTVNISSNLAGALEGLRQEDEDINLWIDTVCINQYNEEERKAQVAIMYRIYKKATSVYAWLGGDYFKIQETFDFFRSFKT